MDLYNMAKINVTFFMRPEFPSFVALAREHKTNIEAAGADILPYSDFNFTSLWCWDVRQETRLSYLFDNLVVVLSDYLSGEPCHTFLGTNRVQETASTLLRYRESIGLSPILKFIPQEITTDIAPEDLEIHEDTCNFDYILDIERLTTFQGSALKPHRNLVTKFSKLFKIEPRVLTLHETQTQSALIAFFQKWAETRRKTTEETANEFNAFIRFFKLTPSSSLIGLGFYVQNELIGFTLNEILPNKMIMIHFEKADPISYPGAYQVIMQETAKYFHGLGYAYINYQQDLGIPGLKQSKASFDPHRYLKKFEIRSPHR